MHGRKFRAANFGLLGNAAGCRERLVACAEGMSQREAAHHFGISRDSFQKMMEYSVPPGCRRKAPIKRPKLDGFTGIIDTWLEKDRRVPRKQRHNAKRVFAAKVRRPPPRCHNRGLSNRSSGHRRSAIFYSK